MSLCWYLSDGTVNEEMRQDLQHFADTYELHPWTASSKFTKHDRDKLIVLFEHVADIYIESDLLDLASELGAELDTLRDLNSAHDRSSDHLRSQGHQNWSGMTGRAAQTEGGATRE